MMKKQTKGKRNLFSFFCDIFFYMESVYLRKKGEDYEKKNQNKKKTKI